MKTLKKTIALILVLALILPDIVYAAGRVEDKNKIGKSVTIFFKDKTSKSAYLSRQTEDTFVWEGFWKSETYNKNDIDAVVLADIGIFGINANYKTVIFKQPDVELSTKNGRVDVYYNGYGIILVSLISYSMSEGYKSEADKYRKEADTYFFKTQAYYDLLNKETKARSDAQMWMTFSITGLAISIISMINYSNVDQTIPSYMKESSRNYNFDKFNINIAQNNDTPYLLLNYNF